MLLSVQDLNVRFETRDGFVNAVNEVSFSIDANETLAIVGESGSGKSQTAFAILGLLARNGQASGSVSYDGKEILNLPESELNRIRAQHIAIIFQDPMTSLNPYLRVSEQMAEVLQLHRGMSRRDGVAEALRMLDAVRIPDAVNRIENYPHEFSGGMRQRIMIAMALLCRPKILIADEPTTALDVTVQSQIMELLASVRSEFGMAVALITHDMGIVAGFCDRTIVMYGGRIMETGTTQAIFDSSVHPYTAGLLAAIPRLDMDHDELPTIAGDPPNMSDPPTGCPFNPRCAHRLPVCQSEMPALKAAGPLSYACHAPIGGEPAQ